MVYELCVVRDAGVEAVGVDTVVGVEDIDGLRPFGVDGIQQCLSVEGVERVDHVLCCDDVAKLVECACKVCD